MIDSHIHLFHGNSGEYTWQLLQSFVEQARQRGVSTIYLLEHSHQFCEFRDMYRPVADFNEYQRNWLARKMKISLVSYIRFIEQVKNCEFPLTVKFGLEICYIPETESLLQAILSQYKWDFVIGSVHYIDDWGFDHKAEFWNGIEVNKAYKRYYEIMFDLVRSKLFNGLAHPDSIKCFGYYPDYDLTETYINLAKALNDATMYAEQSGGLTLNYGFAELGLNPQILRVFKDNGVRILTASDAHKPEHAGENISKLQALLTNDEDGKTRDQSKY
ncbi:PHP domain-containing protein [Sporomusa sp.]|uniref:PHP domain-containing protein n=1 Tax=Sporomusa sp. TaxID=2078658 RepID=UPI002BE79C91|nr:PHP domain-containing protein [Sporomusa sp.]HWR05325.1 PHP domain-containing protein [Sporomusa sp.]